MANPLSDRGWSDRDYAAAVGTLMGEAAAKGNLRDFQAIADVITNRLEAGVYGKSVAGITMNPREFSTWSPREKGAFAQARAGFAAALNPSRAAALSPSLRGRVEMAQKALEDVNVTGIARGVTQGATAYHNPAVTAKLGTGGWHNMLEDKYGAVDIGAHTFTGPGFRPDDTFDPITYNGQLAAPKAADPYFGDVMFGEAPVSPVPIGQVTSSSIPDITPAREAGFSWDLSGATLPADLSLDFASPMDMGTFNDIFDAGFQAPAAPAQMSQNTFNDVFDAGFPMDNFTPVDAAPVDFSDVVGPAQQPSGFSAGFDAGPYGVTPDYSAPSLEQRNAEAFNQDAIKSLDSQIGSIEQSIAANELANGAWNEKVMNSPTLGSFDTTRAGIRDQEAEFGIPQEVNRFDGAFNATPDLGTFGGLPSMASLPGPALTPDPIEAVTAPTATASIPQGDFDEFGENFPGATAAPQASRAAPSSAPVQSRVAASTATPSFSLPETAPLPPSRQQMEISKQFDLPSFSLPSFDLPDIGLPSLPTARDVGGFVGMSPQTMDSIGNFMDSRLGKATTGAGIGFLTGGPIGAITNGLWGGLGIGDRLSQEFDRYANAYGRLAPEDFAMFGLDGNWTDREPTRNTGYEGGSRVGDGSFSDVSGYNDNNPQGIL